MHFTTTAVIIPAHNEAATIFQTVKAARANNIPVYVVDDNSSDNTAEIARQAGAQVLSLKTQHGKAAALRALLVDSPFERLRSVAWVVLCDADTHLAPNFVTEAHKARKPGVVAVTGQTNSDLAESSVNPFQMYRAMSGFWSQHVQRRAQSWFNAVTVLAGSNALIKADVFRTCLLEECTTSTDDSVWLAIITRQGLGRVIHAPHAVATTADPFDFTSYYKQSSRWTVGTAQTCYKYSNGTKLSMRDAGWAVQYLDWLWYLILSPTIVLLTLTTTDYGALVLGGALAGGFLRTLVAAVFIKRPLLIVCYPVMLAFDLLNRVQMIESFVLAALTYQQNTSASVWSSPERKSSGGILKISRTVVDSKVTPKGITSDLTSV